MGFLRSMHTKQPLPRASGAICLDQASECKPHFVTEIRFHSWTLAKLGANKNVETQGARFHSLLLPHIHYCLNSDPVCSLVFQLFMWLWFSVLTSILYTQFCYGHACLSPNFLPVSFHCCVSQLAGYHFSFLA